MDHLTELRAAHNSEPYNLISNEPESDENPNLFRNCSQTDSGTGDLVDTRTYRDLDSEFRNGDREQEYKPAPLPRSPREAPQDDETGYDFLSAEDEAELVTRWQQHGDVAARNKIIVAYQPLCANIASKYPSIDFEEGVQIANLAMIKGLDKFDLSLGYRVSTHARHWIHAEIIAFARKSKSVEHRPKKKGTKEQKQADNEFRLNASLDAVIGESDDGSDQTMLDVLSDDDHRVHPDFARSVAALDDFEIEVEWYRDQLRDALAALDDRERRVVTARFLSDIPVGLIQLSKELGVSSERARQIGDAGLKKIRSATRKADRYRSARNIARAAFDRNYRRTGEADPTIYGAVCIAAPPSPYFFQWWRGNVQAFTPLLRNLPPAYSAQNSSVRPGQSEGPTAQRLREERASLTAAVERQRAERTRQASLMSRDIRDAA